MIKKVSVQRNILCSTVSCFGWNKVSRCLTYIGMCGQYWLLYPQIVVNARPGSPTTMYVKLVCPFHCNLKKSIPILRPIYDGIIKWKKNPRYCPLVRGIHQSTGNSPHNSQWRGALVFSLICTRMNDLANNREAGDLKRHRAYYGVSFMYTTILFGIQTVFGGL